MPQFFLGVVLLFACCLPARAQAAQAADDLSGLWEFIVIDFGEADVRRLRLQASGETITGTLGSAKVQGKRRGDSVEFEARFPDGELFGSFTGRLTKGEMAGEAKLHGTQSATWSARRPVVRPADAPRIHKFVPSRFHNVFSPAVEPALRIFPGDTVQTTTIDAGGRDEKGNVRWAGGNPLTGPFYVDGALPGDTLVVRFHRIRLNRDSAFSGRNIAGSALTPGYLRNMKPVEKFDSSWTLDHARGVAMLAHPTEALKNFTVPLAPMLGCVGVAPPGRQSFTSGHLGNYGGNLDYNRMREGITVYLPVYHPGALLFVGDGHAAQGDGELTGGALETSMEVEFTVDLVQDKRPNSARAEDAQFRMAFGVGGSLTDALQQATTEMARWLENDYGLNPAEAAIVLGFWMQYDVAELVDPEIHVAARVSKTALASLPQPKR